jgi:formate dehydrogenase maturation protein FdhE
VKKDGDSIVILCEATSECGWSMITQAVSSRSNDSLVEMFRKTYSSLNPDFQRDLVDTVTKVFAQLIDSLSEDQVEKAWVSLGRLLTEDPLSNSRILARRMMKLYPKCESCHTTASYIPKLDHNGLPIVECKHCGSSWHYVPPPLGP